MSNQDELLVGVLMTFKPSTVTIVADLTSPRASQLFHSVKLHSTAVVPLDLYAELMLEAAQQMTPDASQMQLQHMTSVIVTHHQQLLVKLTANSLSIQHQANDTEPRSLCAQATLVQTAACQQDARVSHLHMSALMSAFMSQPAAVSAAMPAAAASATLVSVWKQDQGFCLPGTVFTTAAQLQASCASAAGFPTAAACVGAYSAQLTEPLVLVCSASGASQLDAELGCSRGVACQLKGVTLVTPQEGLCLAAGASLHSSQDAPMLYEVQWKAAGPALQAATHTPRIRLLPSVTRPDHVQACAGMMASAQHALQGKGHQLNLQPGTGPNSAMALALLRSVAQEAAQLTCSASLTASHNTVTSPQAALDVAAPVRKNADGLVYEPRLVPSTPVAENHLATDAADSCIILGGTGSIGSLAATWMVDRGLADIIMVGRTGKLSPASAANFATMLAQQGKNSTCATMISITRCDTACEEESRWLYHQARNARKLILHAGGVLADATVSKQSLSGIRQAFAAKAGAAQHAHHSTACYPTAGMVLFSSVASLLGSAGQANYSAANGALDGLAAQWAYEGRGVCAVQWGPWAGKSICLMALCYPMPPPPSLPPPPIKRPPTTFLPHVTPYPPKRLFF